MMFPLPCPRCGDDLVLRKTKDPELRALYCRECQATVAVAVATEEKDEGRP